MNLRPYILAAAAVALPAALTGCPGGEMTVAEAGQARYDMGPCGTELHHHVAVELVEPARGLAGRDPDA